MSLGFKTIEDINYSGKRVLLRAEFNVPLADDLTITDDSRIQKTIPTIQKILADGPKKLIIMAHLGRPKGKKVPEMSMRPVAERLSLILGEKVGMADDCIDTAVPEERIVLLENLRFHEEETNGDEEFGKKLSVHGETYVNDAFGVTHRNHASVAVVPKYLESAAGYLIEEEISKMSSIIDDPERPFSFILGCAKLDKIPLIEKMLDKADNLLLGGGVVFTFMKSMGVEIGTSIVDCDHLELARRLYEDHKEKIILPDDYVVALDLDPNSETRIVPAEGIPADMKGLDIGPESVEKFKSILRKSRTIVWNGPMGVYEIENFAKSTRALAEFITSHDAKSLIGGGDTVSAIKKFGLEKGFTHVSSGGGASLSFIQGDPMPGIDALKNAR